MVPMGGAPARLALAPPYATRLGQGFAPHPALLPAIATPSQHNTSWRAASKLGPGQAQGQAQGHALGRLPAGMPGIPNSAGSRQSYYSCKPIHHCVDPARQAGAAVRDSLHRDPARGGGSTARRNYQALQTILRRRAGRRSLPSISGRTGGRCVAAAARAQLAAGTGVPAGRGPV